MPSYDISLIEEHKEMLEQIAKDKGLTIDEAVNEIVYNHLVNSNKITRFAAKKGPKKR